MSYTTWEIEITEKVAAALGCTDSDAAGVVEAQPFVMAQSWAMGLDAQATADKVINQ